MRRVIAILIPAVLIAAIVALVKAIQALSGLSEDEIRAKVTEKTEPRMGAETAAEIADAVVEAMAAKDKFSAQVGEAVEEFTEAATGMYEEGKHKVEEVLADGKEQVEEAAEAVNGKVEETLDV